ADRSARLERWQIERACSLDLDVAPHQQRVAVPTEAPRPLVDRRRTPRRVVEHRLGQYALALAEAIVALLQRDHVGADLAQHGDDAVGIAAPVHTDALVNVVAGEGELHARFNAAQSGTVPGSPAM